VVLVAGLPRPMYTSAVADVRKNKYSSLRFVPLSKGQRTHHLFYVSGVIFFKDRPFCLPQPEPSNTLAPEILVSPLAFLSNGAFDKDQDLAKNVIVDINEINFFANFDTEILNSFEDIFICSDKPFDGTNLDFLEPVKSKVSFLILENHNLTAENLFKPMPGWLVQKVKFVYLPKQSPRDSLLGPAEVVERMEVRASQCFEQPVDLNIVSFGAGALSDINLVNFYSFPSADAHIKIVEREKYVRYFLIKALRASGLAGILGFIFWLLKIALNPSDYSIGLELSGWGYRILGWLHGLIVDFVMLIKRVYGLAISFGVNLFWFLKRNIGRSWQIRLFLKGLWGNRWRAQVYLQRKIGELWRIKAFLLKLMGESWRLRAYTRRLLGESWRLRAYTRRLLGESWRLRVFIMRLYTYFKQGPLTYLIWPFIKVYWFAKYQIETRILGKTNRESGNE